MEKSIRQIGILAESTYVLELALYYTTFQAFFSTDWKTSHLLYANTTAALRMRTNIPAVRGCTAYSYLEFYCLPSVLRENSPLLWYSLLLNNMLCRYHLNLNKGRLISRVSNCSRDTTRKGTVTMIVSLPLRACIREWNEIRHWRYTFTLLRGNEKLRK